ncbi:CD63 antigen-like [Chrysoperla carnea]|uniref:CD63 antigen-like n=1 Tax=Chrysoperla carnea TaxID=189513 RepID=UPI001D0937CF|nr:CD63 antigen-like [Chrysoperla carnea]
MGKDVKANLCGLGLLTVGVMYKLQMDDLDNILAETNLSVAPMLLIVVGSVIFIISFFGCCGTIRENHCMVVTYATILLSILIIQIALGVYVYMGSSSGNEKPEVLIQKAVRNVFAKYKDDPNARQTFDVAQSNMHCCGINGPSDYALIHQMVILPSSCCMDGRSTCPVIPLNIGAQYWTDGCLEKLENLASKIGTVLSIVLLAIVGVEIVGIIFALCLANSIKNSERRMGV